jgi:Tol biopolymer transport system component
LGIVHRDLKPANILLAKSGVKLLDFGLAKLARTPGVAADQTLTLAITAENAIVGTLQYMSPEQLQAKDADAHSDIFCFGCVLYEILAGRHAFEGQSRAGLMSAILRDEPAPLGSLVSVPAGVERVVKRCLAKDPDGRWQCAADLGDELRWLAASGTAAVPQPSAPYVSRKAPLAAGLIVGLLAGATAAHWLWTSAPPQSPVPRHLTYSGRDSSPAVSADGKAVAFVSGRDGRSRIWLKQLAGGNEISLTSGPDDNPRFSPDGTMILFTRNEGSRTSLYRVSNLGGDARKIIDDVAGADFSPDGRRIAFLRWKSEQARESSVLGLVGVDGSDPTELAVADLLRLDLPRWSPDGAYIAAIGSQQSGFRDRILIVSADGKSKHFLERPSTSAGVSSVAWLSKEEVIYLFGDRYVAEPPVLVRQNIRSGARRLYPWAHFSQVLDVTRTGALVFDTQSPRSSLREVTIHAKANAQEYRWLARGNSVDRQPAYSPDGKRIVFSSNRSGNMDLWQLSTESGSLTRLTDHPAIDFDPAFTPDGKSLIWTSNRNGHYEIYMGAVDTSAVRQVTQDGRDAENPTMTADGKWIVYASAQQEKLGIWKIHADGSAATRLITGPHFNPEVSPDGQYTLYLTTLRTDRNVIRVLRMADGAQVPFEIACDIRKQSGWIIGRARWMPDGKAIAFIGQDENGVNGVYTQDFVPGKDTGASRTRLTGFDLEIATETLGISPDGKHLTISSWDQVDSIMMADRIP